MEIILDADLVIRGEKGSFDLASWLRSGSNDQFQLAAVTVAELWHGVERATEPQRGTRMRYLEAVVDRLPIIPYTRNTAHEHARIWASLERAGKMIGYYDWIVAATALEHGSQVATFNRKHFETVPGLTVVQPSL